jgi:predicted protein tyrosine phosphatase
MNDMKLETVYWMSRRDAERATLDPTAAWISITDPALPEANIQRFAESEILRLKFHDADGNHSVVMDGTPKDQLTYFGMTHALAVLDFLDRVSHTVTHINVHCEGGVPRSAAVARFIAEWYQLKKSFDYMESYSLYNKYVYNALRSVAYARLMGRQIKD